MAQRRGFRGYLAGLPAPRERNKTLTALAGAEPVAGSKLPAVQRLQFFLSAVAGPLRQDRQRRRDRDHAVGRRAAVLPGARGAVHPGPALPGGKERPGFRTKLAIGAELAVRAREAGSCFRAVAAGSACGDQDGFRAGLAGAGLPFVTALKPRRGTRARGENARTPVDAARELAWGGPDDPGDWQAVTRASRDGHAETWYAAEAALGSWGPDGVRRLVAVTVGPATLPPEATWYLVTNLPRPGGPREAGSPHPAASLAEPVRIYGLRNRAGLCRSLSSPSSRGCMPIHAPDASRMAPERPWWSGCVCVTTTAVIAFNGMPHAASPPVSACQLRGSSQPGSTTT